MHSKKCFLQKSRWRNSGHFGDILLTFLHFATCNRKVVRDRNLWDMHCPALLISLVLIGTAYPSGAPEFIPGFSVFGVTRSLVLCVMPCWSLFVLLKCLYQVRVITIFRVFRLLSDFVSLYTYEFWLSFCKIVRSSVILLLPLFVLFSSPGPCELLPSLGVRRL